MTSKDILPRYQWKRKVKSTREGRSRRDWLSLGLQCVYVFYLISMMLLPTQLNSCRPGYLHKCFIISHQCTILARSHREMANSCQLTFKPYLIRLQGEVRTRNSRLSTLVSRPGTRLSRTTVSAKKKKARHTTSCHWVGAWVCASECVCEYKLLRQCQHAKFFLPQRWQMTTSWTHAF